MKPALHSQLSQQLTLTPQLQQAIRLLQLSQQDLLQEIQQQLESNPLLELSEELENQQTTENLDHNIDKNDQQQQAQQLDFDSDYIPFTDVSQSLWSQTQKTGTQRRAENYEDHQVSDINDASIHTLQEYLLWQMRLTPLSPSDQIVAMAIIDAIDDDGYLTIDLQEIKQCLGNTAESIEMAEIEAILHRIQQFDPIGVGCRNLQAYLLFQLDQLPNDTHSRQSAKQLIKNNIDLLAKHDYKAITKNCQLSKQELALAIRLIKSLYTCPNHAHLYEQETFTIPDVVVKKDCHQQWQVRLNKEIITRVNINPYYAGLIKRADNSASNQFLKDQLQEARWFLKSLQSRDDTLLKVANCIIKKQHAFLDKGEEFIKPLILLDIAEETGLHESTISRITSQKTMATPRGLFELKYFFSSHVSTKSGEDCSSTAIRALIKKLIRHEPDSKPYSDNKIAQLLEQHQGIKIARRTIAKYRESMKLPPSNERKNLNISLE